MCKCTPEMRTPFCGKPGCEWPPQSTPEGEPEWTTRRAPHMERYTRVVSYPTEEFPDAHALSLVVGNQSFLFSNGVDAFYENHAEALWARDMLCIALDALVKEHVTNVSPPGADDPQAVP